MHYNYNALCGGVVHEICSNAYSFDLMCESVTFIVEQPPILARFRINY